MSAGSGQLPDVQQSRAAHTIHVALHASDELDGRRARHVLEREGFRVSPVHDSVDALDGLPADVVVLCGDDAAASVRAAPADVPVVVVSRGSGRAMMDGVLAAGATGFVGEDQLDDRLGPTVVAVAAGQLALPAACREAVIYPILSPRERQVMSMVVLGFSNQEVANKLHVTETTVKSHLSSAYRKLGVRSRHEATALILSNKELGLGILSLLPGH